MSTTTTTYLGLIKSGFNTEKDAWGEHLNDSFDLIDAFALKVPARLNSGSVSNALLDITLPTGFERFQIVLTNIRGIDNAAELFARLSFNSGSSYLDGASDYEYVRRDLSSKSSGTQTLAGGTASAIMLSPGLKQVTTTWANTLTLTLDWSLVASDVKVSLEGVGNFRNSDSTGYRTRSDVAGSYAGTQVSRPTNIRIGGLSSGSYTDGIDADWALFGIPV